MADLNTSKKPVVPGLSEAQSASRFQAVYADGTPLLPPGAIVSMEFNTFPHLDGEYEKIPPKIIEFEPKFIGEELNPKPRRFTPELNETAHELWQTLYQIQERIRDGVNPLFSNADGILYSVKKASESMFDFIRNCQTIDIKDDSVKTAIEDIIPKLLKHAKMVLKNLPELEPKPWNVHDLRRFDALRHLCEQVGEAERDPAKWEDVKKTLIEAKTPNAYWLATSFDYPYDKLDNINWRLRLEAQKAELADSAAELARNNKIVVDFDVKERSIDEQEKWLAVRLERHPEIADKLAETQEFYQRYLQGTASEEEVEAYYADHPFGFTDKTDMEMSLKVLSEVLAEKETLHLEEVE
ncbi:hypothetical protein FKW77_008666 [Venturia effusa]|uniref:Uncharacterized protein n=1 Tax=Venturia effusa TaxID=50376 RepID=A0A517L3Z4_9PEZI|nr:hypothetical protein FKW77_008666 [Venturia effusa]